MADIVISGQDEYATLEATLSVEYDYYDDQGWMLDTENSDPIEIYAKDILEEMSEGDMIYTLRNFDNSLTFISGVYDSECETQSIHYERVVYDTYFFKGVSYGELECSYLNTDRGWQVINNYEDEPQISVQTQNVPGRYLFSGAGWGGSVMKIDSISEDWEEITFTPEGNIGWRDGWNGGEMNIICILSTIPCGIGEYKRNYFS